MKAIVQTCLIAGGLVGILITTPIAFFANAMRSFGGDLTGNDKLLLAAPILCVAALIGGLLWRKSEKKKQRV